MKEEDLGFEGSLDSLTEGLFGVLVGLGREDGGAACNGSFGFGIVACGRLDEEGTAKVLTN